MKRRDFLLKVPAVAVVAAVAAPEIVRVVTRIDLSAKAVTVQTGALTEEMLVRFVGVAFKANREPGPMMLNRRAIEEYRRLVLP